MIERRQQIADIRKQLAGNDLDDGKLNGFRDALAGLLVELLAWDPGTTHPGTQVKSSPHALGGPFIYKIVALSTASSLPPVHCRLAL